LPKLPKGTAAEGNGSRRELDTRWFRQAQPASGPVPCAVTELAEVAAGNGSRRERQPKGTAAEGNGSRRELDTRWFRQAQPASISVPCAVTELAEVAEGNGSRRKLVSKDICYA